MFLFVTSSIHCFEQRLQTMLLSEYHRHLLLWQNPALLQLQQLLDYIRDFHLHLLQ
jgi:hypothetical protein